MQSFEQGRAEYLGNLEHRRLPGAVDMGDVMAHLRKRLPAEAVLASGAGNFTVWAHRFYEFRRFRTQLAPTSGAMGYGVPAAVAAKIVHPERVVVALAGDGDFLMTGQELATAVQYDLAVVTLVVNNGMYGTIRMHQERHYPGRVSGTDLVNPDFAALARAYGAYGATVERTDEFPAAFEEALASGRPALLELLVDPEALTPRQTLSEIREAALDARKECPSNRGFLPRSGATMIRAMKSGPSPSRGRGPRRSAWRTSGRTSASPRSPPRPPSPPARPGPPAPGRS